MPAERSHALSRLLQVARGHGGIALTVRFKIYAHATNPGRVHVGERASARGVVNDGDTARARAELAHGVDRAGIVRAVGARMHDHDPVDMQRAMQGF